MKALKRAAYAAVLLLTFGPGWILPQALAQLGGVVDTVTDTVDTLIGGGTSTGGSSTGGSSSGGTSTGDTTAPTVTMTAPTSGQTVSGTTVKVSANASDSGSGIAVVRFYVDAIDSAHLIKEEFSAPYEFSWNSTTVSNGSHAIAAVAHDKAGNEKTSAPVTFTVANGTTSTSDTTRPMVSIATPAAGATVSGTFKVTANASDSSGIAVVQFFVDGATTPSKEEFFAPYEFSWNTAAVSDGSHTITAVAHDKAGNTNKASVTVTVANGDTTPPTVSIASPAAGATVSGTFKVTANASDSSGIAVVQFFVDGATTPSKEEFFAPYEFDWVTTAVSDGSHTITAVAHDKAGNTNKASVIVTVANGTGGGTTTTRTEAENLPAASFAGTWTVCGPEIAAFSGGVAGCSNATGATVTFTFTGTAVSWIGLKCNVCGIATVSIDGGPATTVDTAGPGIVDADPTTPLPTSEPVFTASGLASGITHTLVITVTGTTTSTSGGAHIVVDAFDVTGGTGSNVTRAEIESMPQILSGSWVARGPEIAAFSPPGCTQNCAASSNVVGDTATFTFTGTGVSWIGLKCNICGIASVSIDGGAPVSVDTTGAAAVGTGTPSEPVFTASGLASGITHTLVITVTGTTTSTSGGAHIIVDAFDVTP